MSAGRFLEGEHELPQVAPSVPGRQVIADLLVKREQADGVALLVQKVAEGGGEGVGVFGLGPSQRAERHRPAVVDQQMTAQVGLILELLDVIAVRAGVEAPIKITRVIARGVLTVLGKLDGETVIRTAMESVPEAFDDDPGTEFEVLDGHERMRRNKVGGAISGHGRSLKLRGLSASAKTAKELTSRGRELITVCGISGAAR